MTQPSPSNQPHGQTSQSGSRPRALTPQELAAIPKPVQASTAASVSKTQAAPSQTITPSPAVRGQKAPTLQPGKAESAGSGGGEYITALWSDNEDRNVWVRVIRADGTDLGWIKLSNASESGTVALSLLASYAKLAQDIVVCVQGNDGLIHEFYAY